MAVDAHPEWSAVRLANEAAAKPGKSNEVVTAAPASIGVMKIAIGVFLGNLITGILGALVYLGLHT